MGRCWWITQTSERPLSAQAAVRRGSAERRACADSSRRGKDATQASDIMSEQQATDPGMTGGTSPAISTLLHRPPLADDLADVACRRRDTRAVPLQLSE